MQIVSLGSGSKGNSTYIEMNQKHILVDCGLSMKKINEHLIVEVGIDLDDIEIIFITHEHSDHILSVPTIYKNYKHIKFAAPSKVFEGVLSRTGLHITQDRKVSVEDGKWFKGSQINVKPIRINHDVPTYAYIFKNKVNGESIAFIADNGGIMKNNLIQMFTGHDYYILESNHDLTMQIFSQRHEGLKRRVLNYYGHTHNAYAIEFVMRVVTNATKGVMFNHLSQECNTENLCRDTHNELIRVWGNVTEFKHIDVAYARQNENVRLL